MFVDVVWFFWGRFEFRFFIRVTGSWRFFFLLSVVLGSVGCFF